MKILLITKQIAFPGYDQEAKMTSLQIGKWVYVFKIYEAEAAFELSDE